MTIFVKTILLITYYLKQFDALTKLSHQVFDVIVGDVDFQQGISLYLLILLFSFYFLIHY